MMDKSRKTAIALGKFIICNIFLPLLLIEFGKELYEIWFKKQ